MALLKNEETIRTTWGFAPEQQKVLKEYFQFKSGCLGKGSMSDEDYLKLVIQKKNSYNLYNRAISHLGLDESLLQEIPPVEFEGFCYKDDYLDLYKYEVDTPKRRYSNVYESTWFFFSDNQFYMYRFAFNMLENAFYDITKEIFYNDVVSFYVVDHNSESNFVVEKGGCFGNNSDNIKKTERKIEFRISLTDSHDLGYSMTGTKDLAGKIQAMRQKLREKKSQNV